MYCITVIGYYDEQLNGSAGAFKPMWTSGLGKDV